MIFSDVTEAMSIEQLKHQWIISIFVKKIVIRSEL
jgi:hypothetical protein